MRAAVDRSGWDKSSGQAPPPLPLTSWREHRDKYVEATSASPARPSEQGPLVWGSVTGMQCVHPHWVHRVMSTQISIRLTDRVVAELDALVASGRREEPRRIVESALERELRRASTPKRSRTLSGEGGGGREDPDLDAWVSDAAKRFTMDD